MAETDWFGDNTATFGDRLATAREAAGLSNVDLARKVGVKVDVIDAWEMDTKEPRANRVAMLSGLLGVSLRWLLTGAGEGPDPDAAAPDADVATILTEMRALRTEMTAAATRLGQLEKRLRAAAAG